MRLDRVAVSMMEVPVKTALVEGIVHVTRDAKYPNEVVVSCGQDGALFPHVHVEGERLVGRFRYELAGDRLRFVGAEASAGHVLERPHLVGLVADQLGIAVSQWMGAGQGNADTVTEHFRGHAWNDLVDAWTAFETAYEEAYAGMVGAQEESQARYRRIAELEAEVERLKQQPQATIDVADYIRRCANRPPASVPDSEKDTRARYMGWVAMELDRCGKATITAPYQPGTLDEAFAQAEANGWTLSVRWSNTRPDCWYACVYGKEGVVEGYRYSATPQAAARAALDAAEVSGRET